MSELKKLDLSKELVEVPIMVSDANPNAFYTSVKKIRTDYKVKEEHIGVNMIVVNVSANGQAQLQAVHYCTALVEMTKADFEIFQAREKLKM